MVNILDITLSINHLSKQCTVRAYPCVDDTEKYYHMTVAIPFIDSFIQQINEQFVYH